MEDFHVGPNLINWGIDSCYNSRYHVRISYWCSNIFNKSLHLLLICRSSKQWGQGTSKSEGATVLGPPFPLSMCVSQIKFCLPKDFNALGRLPINMWFQDSIAQASPFLEYHAYDAVLYVHKYCSFKDKKWKQEN